jgi:bifunctional DNase/RNase
MRRVRLDIGAVAASPEEGGSFTFFLYREGMDRSLPVPLTPPQMHSILSNFRQIPGASISMQSLFSEVLQEYRIELLEVSIVKSYEEDAQENDGFVAELLFFDGDKEIRKIAGFVDGIILSKSFSCPIYISEELLDRYAREIDLQSKDVLDKETLLSRLKDELQQAINNEEYEKASAISKRIESIKNNNK